MIEIHCSVCGDELKEQGALMFSPPTEGTVVKNHLCTMCSKLVYKFLDNMRDMLKNPPTL